MTKVRIFKTIEIRTLYVEGNREEVDFDFSSRRISFKTMFQNLDFRKKSIHFGNRFQLDIPII